MLKIYLNHFKINIYFKILFKKRSINNYVLYIYIYIYIRYIVVLVVGGH